MEFANDDVWVGDTLFVDVEREGLELKQLLVAGLQSIFADMPAARAAKIADDFISALAAERGAALLNGTTAGLLAQDRALFDTHSGSTVSFPAVAHYLTRRLNNDHSPCPATELVERCEPV